MLVKKVTKDDKTSFEICRLWMKEHGAETVRKTGAHRKATRMGDENIERDWSNIVFTENGFVYHVRGLYAVGHSSNAVLSILSRSMCGVAFANRVLVSRMCSLEI